MKLAEALVIRADIQKRISQINDRIANSARVQEGDVPPISPEALVNENMRNIDNFTKLVAQINYTNCTALFDDKQTMAEVLAKRDGLMRKIIMLQTAISNGSFVADRYSNAEIRTVSTIDIAEYQKKLDELSQEWRQLDLKLQQANWLIDLIEK